MWICNFPRLRVACCRRSVWLGTSRVSRQTLFLQSQVFWPTRCLRGLVFRESLFPCGRVYWHTFFL
ncbi:hypothetical protein FR483_n842L [Paramecium bursaria Chlorella virus FR483]|uniref:Uncharacterized protein n842L n=1 Tax=Paramecium bursaria Chlorella virus FR483 TaxID=399781 RepID=A7J8J6_PBCVF|nr:hypothetical protein FR483_n842L [Paramecium bursaria Chlorella virus FR483]ABT16127.1 hypothetical protein FR483_n842L [Paramecium bursaria Chlorella virus FR483]